MPPGRFAGTQYIPPEELLAQEAVPPPPAYRDTSMYSAPVENQYLAGGPAYEPPYNAVSPPSPSAALHHNESFPAPTGQKAPPPDWDAFRESLNPSTGSPDENVGGPAPRLPRPIPQGNLADAVWGGLGFLGQYATGRRNLVDDVSLQYAPYDEVQRRGGTPALMEAQSSLPEWLQYANGVLREQYFADPMAARMSPESAARYDRTDAYMGLDRNYLRRMENLPAYMIPARPLLARIAHAVRELPSPVWAPPYLPGQEPQPDQRLGDAFRESQSQSLEPNVYYDDPYLPNRPSRGRRA